MRTLWLHHSSTYLCSLQTPLVSHTEQKHAMFRALVVIPLPSLTLCIPHVFDTVLNMFAEILFLALQRVQMIALCVCASFT